jgi:ABC-type branched-subunit amino acid transport system substrate-binding protein
MTDEPTVQFTFAVNDPELDDEEWQEIALELLPQLRRLDQVEKVERAEDLNPEAGAKPGFATLVGFLSAEVSANNIKDVLSFLGDRLGDKSVVVQVRVGEKEVKIEAKSRQELEAAEALAKKLLAELSEQKITAKVSRFTKLRYALASLRGNIFRTPISVSLLAVLGFGGYCWYRAVTPLDSSKDIFKSQLFSQGEQTFFPSKLNPQRHQGILAFKNKDYLKATKSFAEIIKDNPKDPESQIYFNNAKALVKGNPVTLAVVVPLAQPKIAEEILRGVAQAQDSFNRSRKEKERLLQIVIANDNNDRNQATQVAHNLSKYSSIIGVIGHYTSAASEAALHEYETGNLAIVSPSSTSTRLKSKVFFRTLPHDNNNGATLADYAIKNNYKRVVVLNNPEDSYSNSLTAGFQNLFRPQNGEIFKKVSINFNVHPVKITPEENQKINAVVLFPNPHNIEIVSALNIERTGIKNLPLLGADILYDQNILEAGNAVEGLVLAVPWFQDEQYSKKFADAAKGRWGREVSWRTATSYDATQALIKALSSSNNPSRQTVLENLKSIHLAANETSGNPLRFKDGERQGQEPVLVKVVRGSDGLQFALVK